MVRRSICIGVVLLLGLVVMVGCAKPPTQEMQAASAAVEKARSAEAEKYATPEFRALRDSLSAMTAEVERQKSRFFIVRSYKKATAMTQTVNSLAGQVEQKAIENKAQLKRESEELLAQAQAAVDSAVAALESAPVGKDTKADIEQLKADLAGLQASLPEVRNAHAQEDFTGAKSKSQGIVSGAENIKMQVQAAVEKVKAKRTR